MRNISHIITAFESELWLTTPEKYKALNEILDSFANDTEGLSAAAAALRGNNPKREWRMVGNAAVIDAVGVISKRMNLFSDISGGTSTELLDAQFSEAMKSKARAVIFHVDSPGGAASGIPEFADKVYEAAQKSDKTIITCAAGSICSGAYYFGSQANEVYLTEATDAGSIGVITSINDDSRLKENAGIKQQVFRTSPLKGPGVGPMTSEQIKSIQERVDTLGELFRGDVSRARNVDFTKFDPASVFMGKKAVEMGLCDGIATLDQILKRYA